MFVSLSMVSKRTLVAALSICFLSSCVHKKYDTPITKQTQQPDKVLFDAAMKDIEHGRYEVARISLNTLMNTYESSEYLAKAKLAIADSWYREAGASGFAQAEAEYKDFQLFYPEMQESAEAQNRVCDIHFRQMDKSDRDWSQTLRAEDECRQVILRYPNSKFAPIAQQKLRAIQESLGEHEFTVGTYYYKRGANPAAANRMNGVVDQYPLYSKSADALYEAGDAYSKMGPRFRQKAGEMFARLVQDYPLSARAEDAKQRLGDMELPIPKPNQAAMDRMKYEEDNYKRPGLMARSSGWLKSAPDTSHAAKVGQPTMTDVKPMIPGSVPVVAPETTEAAANTATPATGSDTGTGGSTTATATDAKAGDAAADAPKAAAAAPVAPLPTNRDEELRKYREKLAKKQAKLNKKKGTKDQPAATSTTSPETPAAASPLGTPVPNAAAPNTPNANPTNQTPANTAPTPAPTTSGTSPQ